MVEGGSGLTETARLLSISVKTLGHWVMAARRGDGVRQENIRPARELEVENGQLKRELSEVKQERDFLKKATAYFAKGNR